MNCCHSKKWKHFSLMSSDSWTKATFVCSKQSINKDMWVKNADSDRIRMRWKCLGRLYYCYHFHRRFWRNMNQLAQSSIINFHMKTRRWWRRNGRKNDVPHFFLRLDRHQVLSSFGILLCYTEKYHYTHIYTLDTYNTRWKGALSIHDNKLEYVLCRTCVNVSVCVFLRI